MSTLAQEIRVAVETYHKAAAQSNDAEHSAALNMADLLTGIAKSYDPSIVIREEFYDDEPEAHEHGFTYEVKLSAAPGMTLGPADWRKDPERVLEALWDNTQAWFLAAGHPREFIDKVEVIGGECFSGGIPFGECDVYESLGLAADEDPVVYRKDQDPE